MIISQIRTSSVTWLANDMHRLEIVTCPDQWLIGTQQVAWLNFTAVTYQSSAFVRLELEDFVGYMPDGTPIANFGPQTGRVVVVGEEPLLEALPATGSQVQLLQYAIPGSLVEVQWTINLPPTGGWSPSVETTQTNLVQEAGTFAPVGPSLFFRAIRNKSGP